jgi:hypothetical protein
MEIKLTKEEAEKYFHLALCNGLNYVESGYSIELTWDKGDYLKAQRSLHKKSKEEICHEDVLMEILRTGSKLKLVDHESGEPTKTIALSDVHERVAKTPIGHLTDMINENDDATTADVIIQTVFYEDVIFG